MSKIFSRFLLSFLLGTVFLTPQRLSAQNENINLQTVVHLLSYVALDYPAAVKDGKVIDQMEFQEQVEFADHAYRLVTAENVFGKEQKEKVLNDLKTLSAAIEAKKTAAEIKQIAEAVKNEIIELSGIQTAPNRWPDIASGMLLYQKKCGECHGETGDGNGVLAKNLDPAPSNFLDETSMGHFSPYQAYNTIKLGVQGTSMRAFAELSEDELWDLAFYIKSLPHQGNTLDASALQKEFNKAYEHLDLKEVATLDDNELLAKIKSFSERPEYTLAALRSLSPTVEQVKNSLPIAVQGLKNALESYKANDKKTARTYALKAYLEGIEPVEARLRSINNTFVSELESEMFQVRSSIEKDLGQEEVEAAVEKALDKIKEADRLLNNQKLSYWLTFILAGSIFLREGLEAFLILAIVLALIRSAGTRKALPWLHGGWISAVVLGIAGWFFADYILQFGGQNREIMEGMISLFAVVILMWAGFWLHDKTYAKQWTDFIKNRIGGLLSKDKMFGLAAFSFMVVFREAFEVILFLQAISIETAQANHSAIGLGALVAALFIVLFAYLFLKYSKVIPVRNLFRYSSWLIVLLAIILMGKGIHALQESGWLPVTRLGAALRAEWLGVYPTMESIGGQLLLLLVILGTFYLKDKRMKIAEAKS